jgi:hypothetical protein
VSKTKSPSFTDVMFEVQVPVTTEWYFHALPRLDEVGSLPMALLEALEGCAGYFGVHLEAQAALAEDREELRSSRRDHIRSILMRYAMGLESRADLPRLRALPPLPAELPKDTPRRTSVNVPARFKGYFDERMKEPRPPARTDVLMGAVIDIHTYFEIPMPQRLLLEAERKQYAKRFGRNEVSHWEHLQQILASYGEALRVRKG